MRKVVQQLIAGTAPVTLLGIRQPDAVTQNAVCGSVDPELFFAEDRVGIAKAKQVCFSCTARTECAEWATWACEYGVFGGLDENERAVLRKGLPAYTLEDANEAIAVLRDLPVLKAAEFSVKHDIDCRTYFRWRKKYLPEVA